MRDANRHLKCTLLLALAVAAIALTGCASARERNSFNEWKAQTETRHVSVKGESADHELPVLDEHAILSDYLTYAALRNPGLEAAFNRWKAALEKILQVRTLPDPRFNYGYFIQEVETRVGPQRHRFGISQTFPWFGKLRLRGETALEEADAMQHQYEAAKLKLFYAVKNAYYDYYYLGRSIAVTEENIGLLRQFEEMARSKYEAGKALYADVIKAQVELDKLRDRLRTLRDLEGPTLAKLNAALNRPSEAKLPWPKSIPGDHIPLDDKDVESALVESNPELKSLDSQAEKEKKAIQLARREFFPDLTLGIDYIETGEAIMPSTKDSGKDPVIFMASINLPIWQGKYRSGVREARARYDAVTSQRTDRANALSSEVKMALFQYRDAARQIELYRDALIPKATQSLKVSQRAFEAGKVDFLSLIDAQRVLLEFELVYERALANHAQRYAEIEMLVGRDLDALSRGGQQATNPSDFSSDTEPKKEPSHANEENN